MTGLEKKGTIIIAIALFSSAICLHASAQTRVSRLAHINKELNLYRNSSGQLRMFDKEVTFPTRNYKQLRLSGEMTLMGSGTYAQICFFSKHKMKSVCAWISNASNQIQGVRVQRTEYRRSGNTMLANKNDLLVFHYKFNTDTRYSIVFTIEGSKVTFEIKSPTNVKKSSSGNATGPILIPATKLYIGPRGAVVGSGLKVELTLHGTY
ncbi:hypothetical protein ACFL51_01240 [Myxococcota bacterium]